MANEENKKLPLPVAGVGGEDHTARIVRDKLGIDWLPGAEKAAPSGVPAGASASLEERVIDTLRSIYDPEIPLNIYDLGLIYRLTIEPTSAVKVEMTLTAPGCPVAGDILKEVKRKVEAIPDVPRAEVVLVWDPPWTKDRLSEAAKLELGLM